MNRKKAGMIAAAVMLPVTAIAGSVAFFFTYAVVRMEKRRKRKNGRKHRQLRRKEKALPLAVSGIRWRKERAGSRNRIRRR